MVTTIMRVGCAFISFGMFGVSIFHATDLSDVRVEVAHAIAYVGIIVAYWPRWRAMLRHDKPTRRTTDVFPSRARDVRGHL